MCYTGSFSCPGFSSPFLLTCRERDAMGSPLAVGRTEALETGSPGFSSQFCFPLLKCGIGWINSNTQLFFFVLKLKKKNSF